MKGILLLIAVFFSLSFCVRGQQMDVFPGSTVARGFIENKGQVRDQNGRNNHEVMYVLNQGAFNMQLRKSGFSYELFAVIEEQALDEAGFAERSVDGEMPQSNARLASAHRVDIEFPGSNRNVRLIPSEPTAARYNFYFAPVEKSRIENVRSYQSVTYENLYDKIDMVVSAGGSDGNSGLKYEFIVHPGGDPGQIRMKYQGAREMSQSDGFLNISFANGFVKETVPYCYVAETNTEVPSIQSLSDGVTAIEVSAYEKTSTLIIDPSIVWGTYFGGENTEDVAEVAVDHDNKPTIAGNTLSTANIATAGAYQTTFAGGFHDFFIAKFNSSAGIEWATYLGGSGRDLGFGISVDNSNDIYFNGKTTSDGLATSGAHQTVRGGNDDAIIAKFLTNTGSLVWCTYLGGTGNEQYRAFIFDSNNDFFACGYTESPNAIATPGAFQEVYAGEGDGFITKWSPDGAVLWSTYYGAEGQDRYHSITTDLAGDLLVVGTTSSTSGIVTPGTYQTTYGGGDAELWLNKFTADGFLIWSTFYGGEGHDRGRGVETDSAGNVYVSGFTNSSTGIATAGAVQEEWSEGYDSQTSEPLDDNLLFKLSADGTTRFWGTYYGGAAKDELWGMNIDQKQKCLYVVGSTQSEALIAYGNAWQPVKGKGSDAMFARWTFGGQIVYGSYFGKDKGEQFEDIELDGNGDIYLVGKTEAAQLPSTYGVYQTYSNGGEYEGLLYKFYGGIACRDLNEPNNSFSNAKFIYARTTSDSLVYGYDGNLRNNTDKDYYKFTVSSGFKHHLIELTGLSHNYNLKVYNSSQVLKGVSNNTGLTSDTIIANNLPLGDYYIQVVAGAPAEFDTLKCYHLNLVKSSSRFPNNGSGSKAMDATPFAGLRLSPNPASAEVTLELESETDSHVELRVIDQAGRSVMVRQLFATAGANQFHVPLTGLAPGFYIAQIKSETVTKSLTLVKE